MPDTATPDRAAAEPMVEVCTRLPVPIVAEIDRRAAEDDRTRSWMLRDVARREFGQTDHITDEEPSHA